MRGIFDDDLLLWFRKWFRNLLCFRRRFVYLFCGDFLSGIPDFSKNPLVKREAKSRMAAIVIFYILDYYRLERRKNFIDH